MDIEGKILCVRCKGSAEFRCNCEAILCKECLNAHDQGEDEDSHVFVSLASTQTIRLLEAETQNIDSDIQAIAYAINESFDSAISVLEKQRRNLLSQLEELRGDSLAKMKNFPSVSRKSFAIHKETESMLRKLRTAAGPLLEEAKSVKKAIFSITAPRVRTQSVISMPQSVSPAEALYCVKAKTSEIFAFNPETEDFLSPPVRCAQTLPKRGCYCYVPDGYLFYSGGKVGNSVVADSFLIRLDTGEVVSNDHMSSPRRQHAVVFLSEQVLIFGGYTGRSSLSTCEKFLMDTREFHRMADMRFERDKIGAVVCLQKVYLTGYGKNGAGSLCKCIEVYDPIDDSFATIPFHLPTNSGTIGFAYESNICFLRSSLLHTYDLDRSVSEQYETRKRRYATCTAPLVCGSKIYFLVSTDDEYVISSLDWTTKSSREVLDLKSTFA